jgi:hypothetical protein
MAPMIRWGMASKKNSVFSFPNEPAVSHVPVFSSNPRTSAKLESTGHRCEQMAQIERAVQKTFGIIVC